VLHGAIGDLDTAIRELQAAIFGLTTGPNATALSERVLEVVSESERSLGLSPQVRLEGSFDTEPRHGVADELVAMLRDVLTDVARRGPHGEVEIGLWAGPGRVRLTVSDGLPAESGAEAAESNGRGAPVGSSPAELAGLAERTATLGGTCVIRQAPDGLRVRWEVPLVVDPIGGSH
jgi:signal transduction histidine kinase